MALQKVQIQTMVWEFESFLRHHPFELWDFTLIHRKLSVLEDIHKDMRETVTANSIAEFVPLRKKEGA